jgi:FkbM family methyltransferase
VSGRGKAELIEVTPLRGQKFKVVLPAAGRDAHEENIARHGAYSHVQDILLKLTGAGSTVVDVGANLGTVAIPLALNGAHVIAYDILGANVGALKAALAANGVDRQVEVRHAAVWDQTGIVRTSAINSNGKVSADGTGRVRAVRLDDELGRRRHIDAVKIDVDGAELNVLRGMERILRSQRPHIVFENYPGGLADFGASMAQILILLRKHRYRIYRLTLNVLSPPDVPEQMITDFFATSWREHRLIAATNYQIRPLSDQEIVDQIKLQATQMDLHRLYVLAVADHLRPAVRDHAEVRPLLTEWQRRYGDRPEIEQARRGLFAIPDDASADARPRRLRSLLRPLRAIGTMAARGQVVDKPSIAAADDPANVDPAPDVAAVVRDLARLTTADGHPNINELWDALKDVPILRLNVKNFGYQLAREAAAVCTPVDIAAEPRRHGLVSKPTTQSDIESPWFRYWCSEIKAAPLYHRKLWEFAFVLQVLFEHDLLREAVRGIGFGCGREPLAAYFASKHMDVLVTDLAPEEVAGRGWAETGQHAAAKESAFFPDIVSWEEFDRHVEHSHLDMNDIPALPRAYDFCWSVCSLEHLGTIQKGLDFIVNSLATLKPGGLAIHTTEFNYLSADETIDNWPTVLFLRKHFEQLKSRVEAEGHEFLGPDFNVGDRGLDRFIDVPPYAPGEGWPSPDGWADPRQPGHLKLAIDGFACTCFGLVIRKAAAGTLERGNENSG